MPKITPEYIIQLVEDSEDAFNDLHARMDADYDRWDNQVISPHQEGEDFPVYEPNSARTYANTHMSLLRMGELTFRVPHGNSKPEQKDLFDKKERLCYGLLSAADNRLRNLGFGEMKDDMAWYIDIRGLIVARNLIVKRKDGTSYVDVTFLDPRGCYWGYDNEGLAWLVHKMWKSKQDILRDYGVELDVDNAPVYDYYDRSVNAIVLANTRNDSLWLKAPKRHGAKRPITLVGANYQPQIVSPEGVDRNLLQDWAESIFSDNRATYDEEIFTLSIYKAEVKKQRDATWAHYSEDGAGELPEVPGTDAEVVEMPTGDRLELLRLHETTKDTALYSQIVESQKQQGSFPASIYGSAPGSLSGYAINLLQRPLAMRLYAPARAMEIAYEMLAESLVEQYTSGAHGAFPLTGFDGMNNYFNEVIDPFLVDGLPPIRVKLVPDIPQDMMAKLQMAQMARQPVNGVPLLPDDHILDEIVEVQDVSHIQDAIDAQMANRASPLAMYWNLLRSVVRQGKPDLAQIIFGEILNLLKQYLAGGMIPAAELPADVASESDTGYNPSILPTAILGMGSNNQVLGGGGLQPAVHQAGPLVPPGTPRPGAQSQAQSQLGV